MRRLRRSLRTLVATGMVVVVAGVGVGAAAPPAPPTPAGPPVAGAVAGLEAGDAVRHADVDRLEEAFGAFVASSAAERRRRLDAVVDAALVENPELTADQIGELRGFLRTVHEALEELARSEALRAQRQRDLFNRLTELATRPAPAATPTPSPEVRAPTTVADPLG